MKVWTSSLHFHGNDKRREMQMNGAENRKKPSLACCLCPVFEQFHDYKSDTITSALMIAFVILSARQINGCSLPQPSSSSVLKAIESSSTTNMETISVHSAVGPELKTRPWPHKRAKRQRVTRQDPVFSVLLIQGCRKRDQGRSQGRRKERI